MRLEFSLLWTFFFYQVFSFCCYWPSGGCLVCQSLRTMQPPAPPHVLLLVCHSWSALSGVETQSTKTFRPLEVTSLLPCSFCHFLLFSLSVFDCFLSLYFLFFPLSFLLSILHWLLNKALCLYLSFRRVLDHQSGKNIFPCLHQINSKVIFQGIRVENSQIDMWEREFQEHIKTIFFLLKVMLSNKEVVSQCSAKTGCDPKVF